MPTTSSSSPVDLSSQELQTLVSTLVHAWAQHQASTLARQHLRLAHPFLVDVLTTMLNSAVESTLELEDVHQLLGEARDLRVNELSSDEPDWVEHIAQRLWITSWGIGHAHRVPQRLLYVIILGPDVDLRSQELTCLTETLQEHSGNPVEMAVTVGLGRDAQQHSRVRVLLVVALAGEAAS